LNYLYINHYVLIGKHICIIFLSLFLVKNFRGTCSSAKMLKRYKARESLGTTVILAELCFTCFFLQTFIYLGNICTPSDAQLRATTKYCHHSFYYRVFQYIKFSQTPVSLRDALGTAECLNWRIAYQAQIQETVNSLQSHIYTCKNANFLMPQQCSISLVILHWRIYFSPNHTSCTCIRLTIVF